MEWIAGSAAYFFGRGRFMGPARAKVLDKGQPKKSARDVLVLKEGPKTARNSPAK